jgi:hypothetical protein
MLDKITLAVCVFVSALQAVAQTNHGLNCYTQWRNGPSHDAHFFPIAVWLQPPQKAQQYLAAGFNTYVGLWNGPTEEQLALLKKIGMKVVCRQNTVGLKHLQDQTIIGWNHGDEPDNAQSLGHGRYGPPIPPDKIIAEYQQMQALDPTRPVILNLGQGVAWDAWTGRGARTGHLDDYPRYLQGCDIASFDIYPAAATSPQVSQKLYLVGKGVQRLVDWGGTNRIVWNCIECTHIDNLGTMATPRQVRAEVWMSLIHGSRGLIYFVHEWKPRFNESALLSNPEMLAAVTAINRQIARLASVLNSPAIENGARVSCPASSTTESVPIAIMEKHENQALYLFAVQQYGHSATAEFSIKNASNLETVDVLGENRTLTATNGAFSDAFQPWAVHLYRIKLAL